MDFYYVGGLTVQPPRGSLRFTLDLGPERVLLGYVVHLKSNHGDKPSNAAKSKRGCKRARPDKRTYQRGLR